jgi:hypothetical protein
MLRHSPRRPSVMRRSALSPDSYTNLFQNRREQSCLKKAQGRANQEILAKTLYNLRKARYTCAKGGVVLNVQRPRPKGRAPKGGTGNPS